MSRILELATEKGFPPTTHTPLYQAGAAATHNNLYKAPDNYQTNAGAIMIEDGANTYGSAGAKSTQNNATPTIQKVAYV